MNMTNSYPLKLYVMTIISILGVCSASGDAAFREQKAISNDKSVIVSQLSGVFDKTDIWEIELLGSNSFYVVTWPVLVKEHLCRALKFYGESNGVHSTIGETAFDQEMRAIYFYDYNIETLENCQAVELKQYFVVNSPIEEGTLIELIEFVRKENQHFQDYARSQYKGDILGTFRISGVQIGPVGAPKKAYSYRVGISQVETGLDLIVIIERVNHEYKIVSIHELHD